MSVRRPAGSSERQQLVNRILSSPQFAHAHMLKQVLLYLVECANRLEEPPKEYEIAVRALNRPETFDPRIDPIVRVSVASIRSRLAAYFSTEGKHEPLRLVIPRGRYRVVFADAAGPTEGTASEGALSRFWAPYFYGRAANVIVYTEPLFFRDNKGRFFRDWYVNDPAACKQVQKSLSRAGFGAVEPAYHYLSTGEVHCLLSLSRMFHEIGVPVETRNSRIVSWNELRNTNLILLGSPRTNSFLSSLQGDDPLAIFSNHIENRQPRPGEGRRYSGLCRMDGKLVRRTEFALVTRRPGIVPGCTITMIAANHGKAIEGAGHFLTLEDKVHDLLGTLELGGAKELPAHFQLLMRVEMMDLSDEVVDTVCVTFRILSEVSAGSGI